MPTPEAVNVTLLMVLVVPNNGNPTEILGLLVGVGVGLVEVTVGVETGVALGLGVGVGVAGAAVAVGELPTTELS